ncbi:MAG: tetraacyldisaccharide 4'-kinase [Candidatus Berkiellales bacterium]
MTSRWLNFWQRKSWLTILLLPLAWLFQLATRLRYEWHVTVKGQAHFNIPIIMVGNISLGGTGKTPLVAWLQDHLSQQGFTPGIVMRGFKGKNGSAVMNVTPQHTAECVGDEALMLVRKCQCPLVIGKNRVRAVQYLLEHFPQVDVVISDDGLQHYALGRDVEIAVIDGTRRLGNGYCLPAGMLREAPSRLKQVDFVVVNGEVAHHEWKMTTRLSETIYNVANPPQTKKLQEFSGKTVHAIAGIGNPARFFSMLTDHGIHIIEHAFADHYAFNANDLHFQDDLPILMTEKDAVKCAQFSAGPLKDSLWAVPLTVSLPEEFGYLLLRRIHGQKITRYSRLPDLQTTADLSQRKERTDL